MNIQKPVTAAKIVSKQWNVRFDGGRSARAKIGFVLLPNEQTIEDDMVRHVPPGVGC